MSSGQPFACMMKSVYNIGTSLISPAYNSSRWRQKVHMLSVCIAGHFKLVVPIVIWTISNSIDKMQCNAIKKFRDHQLKNRFGNYIYFHISWCIIMDSIWIQEIKQLYLVGDETNSQRDGNSLQIAWYTHVLWNMFYGICDRQDNVVRKYWKIGTVQNLNFLDRLSTASGLSRAINSSCPPNRRAGTSGGLLWV